MRFKNFCFIVGIIFSGLFFSACAQNKTFLAKDAVFPKTVAVLPFTNDTNDVTAPEIVRKIFVRELAHSSLQVQDAQTTLTLLQEKLGITDGGQLGSVAWPQLAQTLGVEGLFLGNVDTFVDLPLGFVRRRTVKATFTLMDGLKEEKLWQDTQSCSSPEVYLNAEDAKRAAMRQVIERQAERIAGYFLEHETTVVVLEALSTLPPELSIDKKQIYNAIRTKKREFELKIK